jgi:hypothetical protein
LPDGGISDLGFSAIRNPKSPCNPQSEFRNPQSIFGLSFRARKPYNPPLLGGRMGRIRSGWVIFSPHLGRRFDELKWTAIL